MLSKEEGKYLINISREVIWARLKNKRYSVPSKFSKMFSFRAGCFINLILNNQLRGSIGYPDPDARLIDVVVSSAEKAAFSDPRFPPVDETEFKNLSIEVNVLNRPRFILVRNPEDLFHEIQIGVDGLICRGNFEFGILLPQVAVEQNWNVEEFLGQTCIKAGMVRDSWRDFNKCRVYKFQTQVFSEVAPIQPELIN
jgi:uncharacterized protein